MAKLPLLLLQLLLLDDCGHDDGEDVAADKDGNDNGRKDYDG